MSARRARLTPRSALLSTIVAVAAIGGSAAAATASSAREAVASGSRHDQHVLVHRLPASGDAKSACVYASDHISMLDQFGNKVGRSFQCALVFTNAAPNWSDWERPWILNNTYPDEDWRAWATTPGTHRRLIITQSLFPGSKGSARWLALGARGAFDQHARILARNLVAAGLGSSVIRLGHEANGITDPDSIPATSRGDREWVRFWRNEVIAMRSVPGAHFQFDWCVNAGYRDIPLRDWYPGNDVVNIIGIDAYDGGVPKTVRFADRWRYLYNEPDGLGAVERFAVAHGKPLSLPEWGLGPARQPGAGQGGDDPAYIRGIASVVKHDNVAYQSYFDADQEGTQFFNSPRSIRAYRQTLGAGAVRARATRPRSPKVAAPSAPWLSLTGGPANAGTVHTPVVTYRFAVQPRYTAVCSLDEQHWRPCTSRSLDVLQNLSPGYHYWAVQVTDAAQRVTLHGRDFVVERTR